MNKLTAKQKAFVAEYLIDLCATQAAIRAGYSEKTARSQGQRMLTNVDIAEAIQKLMAKRAERTEIDADYVISEITQVIKDRRGTGKNANPNAVLKGAELLGRHLAMFTDKVVADLNHGLQEMDDDALEAHARRLAEKLGVKLPKSLITPTGGKVR